MLGQGNVPHARIVAHPCYPLGLFPLNEFYRGSLLAQ